MDEKRVKNLWDDPETVAESLGLLVDDGLDGLVVDGAPSLIPSPLLTRIEA